MKTIAAAYTFVVMGLAVLAGVTVALAFVLIVVDVTIRTLGVPPPSYTIAIVEYALLYLTMFSAPYLVRKKGHVFIDALTSRLPGPAERVVNKFTYVVSVASSLVVVYFSWGLLLEAIQSGIYEERGIDIPQWLLYFPIPFSFALVAVEFARYLVGPDSMYRGPSDTRGNV